jgi:hypothetical protein
MKNNTTIQELRKCGWKVAVMHGTDVRHDKNNMQINDTHITHIIITDYQGNHAQGFSYSHPQDNYNRKLGNKIALGRAMKNWENRNFCTFHIDSK